MLRWAQNPVGWNGHDSRHSLLKGPQALCVPAALNKPPGGHPKGLTCCLFHTYRPARKHCFCSCPEGIFFFPGSCSLVLWAIASSLSPCVPSSHQRWFPVIHEPLSVSVHLSQMFEPQRIVCSMLSA